MPEREQEIRRACAWIVGRDTGLSSIGLWAMMMGVEPGNPSIPHDLDDFGRCYRLLETMPEWRQRLPEMAAKYPLWAPIIAAWPAWEQKYLEAEYCRRRGTQHGACHAEVDRLRGVVKDLEEQLGWGRRSDQP